jgi:DNA-directed RNA polymerase subunit RPC12/RpoP
MMDGEKRDVKRCSTCGQEVTRHFRIPSLEVGHAWAIACPSCGSGARSLGHLTRCIDCGRLLWRAFDRGKAAIIDLSDYPGLHGEVCTSCIKDDLIRELKTCFRVEPSRRIEWLLRHQKFIIPKLMHVDRRVKQAYPGIEMCLCWGWGAPWFRVCIHNTCNEEQADEIFKFADECWHEPVEIFNKLFIDGMDVKTYGAGLR